MASQGPFTPYDSSMPGQGGMVAPTAVSGSSPSDRNWKRVPTGMVMDMPGPTSTVSSRSPSRRHIRPRPDMKYQTSSMVRCATALETAFGGRVKCAMLPRSTRQRTRTSEPSGAMSSGASLICLVSKVMGCPPP